MALLTGRDGMDEAIRLLIADDARFAADLALSLQRAHRDAQSLLALGMSGLAARVTFEGMIAARTGTVSRGMQDLVDALPASSREIAARARHATKLGAGRQDGEPPLEALLLDYLRLHQHYFRGTVPLLRRLLPDASRFRLGSHQFGVSLTAHFQLGTTPELGLAGLGPLLGREMQQQGEVLRILLGLGGDRTLPAGALPLELLGDATLQDVHLTGYLRRRFGDLPLARQLVLVLIEAQLNFALHALQPAEAAYPDGVFRVRYLTLVHALQELQAMPTTPSRPPVQRRLKEISCRPEVAVLITQPGPRNLRNRLMHYWIRSTTLHLYTGEPLLGLVEAVQPGETFSGLEEKTRRLLIELSENFEA